jgi:hypothetical protein
MTPKGQSSWIPRASKFAAWESFAGRAEPSPVEDVFYRDVLRHCSILQGPGVRNRGPFVLSILMKPIRGLSGPEKI